MASSIGVAILEAIVSELGAHEWSPKLIVQRVYSPEIVIADLTDDAILRVKFSDELPTATMDSRHSRGKRFIEMTADLLLASKASTDTFNVIDELYGLYEEIDQYLFANAKTFVIGDHAVQWVNSLYLPPGDVEQIRTQTLVEIVGSVTYRYER